MTLTKHQIVEDIRGLSPKKAAEAVERLLEIMKTTMAEGEDLLISNFGKFQVREKGARKGRNPATGENMELAPRRVVTFKPSNSLREKMNSSGKKRRR